jgi:hypothetical protein
MTCCCSGVHFDADVGEVLPGVKGANPEGLSLPHALNPSTATATTDTDTTHREDITRGILPQYGQTPHIGPRTLTHSVVKAMLTPSRRSSSRQRGRSK